jgi:hypothetical protein
MRTCDEPGCGAKLDETSTVEYQGDELCELHGLVHILDELGYESIESALATIGCGLVRPPQITE